MGNKSKSDTKEAVKILREQGYIVNYAPEKRMYSLMYGGCPEAQWYTPEEIIKRAKWAHKRHGKSDTKHYDHRRDRRATKQKIDHEEYDDLSHNKQTHREDSWNWD